MSGYSATQMQAHRSVDRSAGQSLVWDAIAAHPGVTRQELVGITGKPINAICGRVSELLDAGQIKVTGSRNGRETLSINAAGRAETGGISGLGVRQPVSQISERPVSAAPLVAITPYLGRRSMTTEQARALLSHPCVRDIHADFVSEARKVLKDGEHWV